MSNTSSSHPSAAPSSTDKHTTSPLDAGPWYLPEYIRFMLLHRDTRAVLMIKYQTGWSLPFVAYKKSPVFDMDRCSRDLQDLLGIASDDSYFTVIVDLVGDWADDDGYGRLLMVEPHVEPFDLPSDAEWVDATFVSSHLAGLPLEVCGNGNTVQAVEHLGLEIVINCMQPESSVIASLRDPRYQCCWFRKAADFLASVVSSVGAEVSGKVIQERLSPSSTMLKVDSTEGWFYLKAPALGCNEASITVKIASLFPDSTVDVVATCDELNCFVMRDLNIVRLMVEDTTDMVQKLGCMQLESLHHLDELRDGGCAVRGPEDVAAKIAEWTKQDALKKIFEGHFEGFGELAPKVIDLCLKLSEYNIPLTLVHGDFARRNASFVSESNREVILYDWQYAYIGHPFCDLHTFIDPMSQEALEEYLGMWSAFESMERAKEAYEVARKVGWCFKMWSTLDCIEQCDPQLSSRLGSAVIMCFERVIYCLKEKWPGVVDWSTTSEESENESESITCGKDEAGDNEQRVIRED